MRDTLRTRSPGRLLDAACGFEGGVHIFPEIAGHDGWKVDAVDLQAPVGIPTHPNVTRWKADICVPWNPPRAYDAYVNISVMEHLTPEDRTAAIVAATVMLKRGGIFVITMDELPPYEVVEKFSDLYDFGSEVPFEGDHLSPTVSFLVGTRR